MFSGRGRSGIHACSKLLHSACMSSVVWLLREGLLYAKQARDIGPCHVFLNPVSEGHVVLNPVSEGLDVKNDPWRRRQAISEAATMRWWRRANARDLDSYGCTSTCILVSCLLILLVRFHVPNKYIHVNIHNPCPKMTRAHQYIHVSCGLLHSGAEVSNEVSNNK